LEHLAPRLFVGTPHFAPDLLSRAPDLTASIAHGIKVVPP
jgi:hypothetical protein